MNAAIKLLLFLNIILGIEKYIILITFNYQKLHIIKITKSEKLENKLITFSNILRGYLLYLHMHIIIDKVDAAKYVI